MGIIGKSWGGFNGLQIAAHRPPELAAVISVASTDDRYADDVHYMGGCVLAWAMLPWASTMLAYNGLPPDPAVVGEAWRETWRQRLEQTPPYINAWLAHQRRDEFWRQGSVCEDYAAIRCPVYMVGGWTDSYRNAILRFLEGYPGPCKGLIGPWGHDYPEDGAPGPAIGFLQEAVRWWDRWLKGAGQRGHGRAEAAGVDAAGAPPGAGIPAPTRAAGWRPAAGRPGGRDAAASGSARERSAPRDRPRPATRRSCGSSAREAAAGDLGQWGGHGDALEFPGDQRPEDGLSLSFDTAPLAEPVEILGVPVARLELAADRPLALVAVRLCDVWPDGASTLITRGLKNLTHRRQRRPPRAARPRSSATWSTSRSTRSATRSRPGTGSGWRSRRRTGRGPGRRRSA